MKTQQKDQTKLSFKKFQISKIGNPQIIIGGNGEHSNDDDDTIDTQN